MKKLYLLLLVVFIVLTGIFAFFFNEKSWSLVLAFSFLVILFKRVRLKKEQESDEIEFDERVNKNMMQISLQIFIISYVLLTIYLIFSTAILKQYTIDISHLLIYLSLSFLCGLYIAPTIVKRN